jgi:hypothetical protein
VIDLLHIDIANPSYWLDHLGIELRDAYVETIRRRGQGVRARRPS